MMEEDKKSKIRYTLLNNLPSPYNMLLFKNRETRCVYFCMNIDSLNHGGKMAHRTEFYLYKRKKKKGSYWYVCYLDRLTGKQGTAKSIDVLKEKLGGNDFSSVTRRDEAVIIAKRALDSGLIFSDSTSILFADYCLEFWAYDRSEYIAMRNSHKPGSIGREYAANMTYSLNKHIIPCLPAGLKLQNVTTRLLDDIVQLLFGKGLSSGSVQIISYSFLLPLKEAERVGYIVSNPAKRMIRISRSEKVRGCLSCEEMDALCALLKRKKQQLHSSYYLAIVLAICTGMRSGEIRALNVEDLVASSYSGWTRINIVHSIATYSGLKGTKSNYDRAILIPNSLASELRANADKRGVCLPSKQKVGYISAPTLRNTFYGLLEEIGISEKEREKRNLTFHSLRHTFSTLGRDSSISQEDRMVVLGHKSTNINNRYTHISEKALHRVASFTEGLFQAMSDAEKSADNLESTVS